MNGYNIGFIRTVKAAVVRKGIQNVFDARLRKSKN